MTRKTKATGLFSNIKLLELQKGVQELESAGHYSAASVSSAYWALQLYSTFFDEIGITEEMFPLNINYLKAFLFELRKVYQFRTLKSIYALLIRAEKIINYKTSDDLAFRNQMKEYFKMIKKNYGQSVCATSESISIKRRPLLPPMAKRLIQQAEDSYIGIRDKSIILTNMIIGQRCDSLQFITVGDISFTTTNIENTISHSFFITVRKEKDSFLLKPRTRHILPSLDPIICPVSAPY